MNTKLDSVTHANLVIATSAAMVNAFHEMLQNAGLVLTTVDYQNVIEIAAMRVAVKSMESRDAKRMDIALAAAVAMNSGTDGEDMVSRMHDPESALVKYEMANAYATIKENGMPVVDDGMPDNVCGDYPNCECGDEDIAATGGQVH
jgi:S-methylmethionine-dependent homocysteine/selenocysteine methylase